MSGEHEVPYRCGAFGTTTGAQCVLTSDHDCPHVLEGTEMHLLLEWAKRKRGRVAIWAASPGGAPDGR